MEFNKLIHQSTRLRILTRLYVRAKMDFTDLQEELDLTEGNLSTHLRKLEKAEYVKLEKTFEERRPRTTYKITKKGRRELKEHIKKLEKLIKSIT